MIVRALRMVEYKLIPPRTIGFGTRTNLDIAHCEFQKYFAWACRCGAVAALLPRGAGRPLLADWQSAANHDTSSVARRPAARSM